MTSSGFSADELDALRAVAEPLNKILSLQRLRLPESVREELAPGSEFHSTQSNHCSSGSVACQIPLDDAAPAIP